MQRQTLTSRDTLEVYDNTYYVKQEFRPCGILSLGSFKTKLPVWDVGALGIERDLSVPFGQCNIGLLCIIVGAFLFLVHPVLAIVLIPTGVILLVAGVVRFIWLPTIVTFYTRTTAYIAWGVFPRKSVSVALFHPDALRLIDEFDKRRAGLVHELTDIKVGIMRNGGYQGVEDV